MREGTIVAGVPRVLLRHGAVLLLDSSAQHFIIQLVP